MTSTPPPFAVVLPVYNGMAYLAESIDSVLAQSFGDFELVIRDDGSTDGSYDVAASYRDSRIRLHRNARNEGLFPTLNRCIAASSAPLVHVWSQDDRMKPQCLEVERRFWLDHPDLGMSYCLRDTIDAAGRVVARALDDPTPEVLSVQDVAWISFFYGCMPGNIASVVLSRAAHERVGGFREDLRVSGDFDMWIRIAEHYPTGFIREALIELRGHAGQFSRQADALIDFMREDRQVLARLTPHLPDAIRAAAPRFNRRLRHVPYWHGIVRALLRGDVASARRMVALLAEWDSPVLVALWWLASGNNRWLRVAPSFQAWQASGSYTKSS